MKNLTTLLTAGLCLFLTACGGGGQSGNDGGNQKDGNKEAKQKDQKSSEDQMPENAMMKNGLTVYPIETKDYPNAKLTLDSPTVSEVDPGEFTFKFSVNNYELKKATPDADKHNLAESKKGQHIHFIVNNGPYQAKYKPRFKAAMEEPGYYTVLSFLSRSYHESVKNPNAFAIKQFKVGSPEEGEQADLSKPHIFYSRPKGTYKGEAMKQLLLDFYPVNVDGLSEDGYKVEATVNDSTTFTFTEHKPYVIEGLEAGDNSIQLRLLDQNDELVDSKFNKVTRTFTLKKGMKAEDQGNMKEEEM